MAKSFLILNMISVLCFLALFWGGLSGKIKNRIVIRVNLLIFTFLIIITWIALFSILGRHGLL